MTDLTLEQFTDARERIAGRVHTTPTVSATLVGRAAGVELFLKCENLQKTGSFKVRGVLNRLAQLSTTSRSQGVVTISAGNHAQALAWAARTTDIPCIVVMPESADPSKVEASREYGADVVLHGDVFQAFDRARALEKERNLTFVHPFDDEPIVLGHGSVGLEILEQLDGTSAVVVPIGGGGLIAGVAAAVKLTQPGVRVYGVEPEGAAAMRRSLDAGRAIRLEQIATIADGLASPMAGEFTYAIVKQYVDDVVTVTDHEILRAMGMILSRAKLLAEPSGAAATAALLARRIPVDEHDRVIAVVSGGNVSVDKLGELLGEDRD